MGDRRFNVEKEQVARLMVLSGARPGAFRWRRPGMGDDYYILPNGLLVFTEKYLAGRGYCCGNGCLHCPYDYMNVPEPKRTYLLQKREADEHGKKE